MKTRQCGNGSSEVARGKRIITVALKSGEDPLTAIARWSNNAENRGIDDRQATKVQVAAAGALNAANGQFIGDFRDIYERQAELRKAKEAKARALDEQKNQSIKSQNHQKLLDDLASVERLEREKLLAKRRDEINSDPFDHLPIEDQSAASDARMWLRRRVPLVIKDNTAFDDDLSNAIQNSTIRLSESDRAIVQSEVTKRLKEQGVKIVKNPRTEITRLNDEARKLSLEQVNDGKDRSAEISAIRDQQNSLRTQIIDSEIQDLIRRQSESGEDHQKEIALLQSRRSRFAKPTVKK